MFKYKYVFPLLKAIVYVPFPIKLMSYVSYVQVGRWRNEEGFVMREDSAWEKAEHPRWRPLVATVGWLRILLVNTVFQSYQLNRDRVTFNSVLRPASGYWMCSPIGSMFRSSSLRMCSMALRHPDKIFATVLPPPQPWPAPTSPSLSPTCRTSSSLQWKESRLDDRTLTRVLSNLQGALRSVHKRKISWPIEESSSSKYGYPIIAS